ncbi:unnamed protein product [Cylicostephanus goldi]|uniref:GH18 domain-containing protein n=1 Tax=Cylicostephanus goldi TaxID=71465 RepID=A0A3P7MXH0_CYLGO|nr:unnamed protein product [Cylicostephanus goldi]
MTPNPNSTKTGPQQFQELYTSLKTTFDVKIIWLQITTPIKWEANIAKNIDFINGIIEAAKTYGVTIGIYTSAYDWQQITHSWTGPILTPLCPLLNYLTIEPNNCYLDLTQIETKFRYWNVLGTGPMAETPSTFDDFHPFGPWTTASIKQFGQEEPICGQTVNR